METSITEKKDEILEQFRLGDNKALAYYHKKHFAALLNYTVSIVKQDDIAMDIVSNAFFKLWNNRMKIEKANNLSAYLYTAARNESFTHLDKTKRTAKHIENYKHSVESFEEFTLKEVEKKSIMYERILAEINNLPNRCRLVVKYTFFKGLNNQQIAKILNISVNTIKNQKTKGLKVLRSRLRELYDSRLTLENNEQVEENVIPKLNKLTQKTKVSNTTSIA